MSVADFQAMTSTTLNILNLKVKEEYLDKWDIETEDEKFAKYIMDIANSLEYEDTLSIMKLLIFHRYVIDKKFYNKELSFEMNFSPYINVYLEVNSTSKTFHDMQENFNNFVIILNYMKQCFGKNYNSDPLNQKWYEFNYNSYDTIELSNSDLKLFLDMAELKLMNYNLMSEKISKYVNKYDIYNDSECNEMFHYSNLLTDLTLYNENQDEFYSLYNYKSFTENELNEHNYETDNSANDNTEEIDDSANSSDSD